MKKMLLCIIILSSTCYGMENPEVSENLRITPTNWTDTLESWKKSVIGEPQYDETLQAILNANPNSLSNNTVTNEHNLDRLLRYLVLHKNLTILAVILPKLVEQKHLWQPGNQARESVVALLNATKAGVGQEASDANQSLAQQIAKLERQKTTLEAQKKAAISHIASMQMHLNQLGSSAIIDPFEMEQSSSYEMKDLLPLFTALQEQT